MATVNSGYVVTIFHRGSGLDSDKNDATYARLLRA